MTKINNKKPYLLYLIAVLFLISPKASMAFMVDGWCEWQGTGNDYNLHCPKDCRIPNGPGALATEESCNAIKMDNSNTQCCRWVKNNVIETSQTSSDDRAYAKTLEATSKPIVFKPSVGLPGFPNNTGYVFKDDSTSPIAQLMAEIYKYAIQIIAVLSLIVIIVGGFLWSMAGGSGQKVTEAKQWIMSGLGGLLLTLFAYLILNTINVNLVNLKTSSIGAIATKNLVVTNKSEKNQFYDDCSMFNKYYANTNLAVNNGSPMSEGCCFFYVPLKVALTEYAYELRVEEDVIRDVVSIPPTTDLSYGASYSYIPALIHSARNECIDYAIAYYQSFGDDLTKFYEGGSANNANGHHLAKTMSVQSTIANFSTYGLHQFTTLQSSYSWKGIDIKTLTQAQLNSMAKGITIFFIEDRACWDVGGYITEATKAKDQGNYCQDKSNYTACLLNDTKNPSKRLWGYCLNSTCQQCKNYGEYADNIKQCPNAKEIQGNNNCVSNFKCDFYLNPTGEGGYCSCNNINCVDNPLNEVMNNLLENFLATKYAMVEEVLYKDKNGTKVGCYNPVDNRRIVTYLESEEIVKKFDTEDNAIQYIENQALLEKEKAGILFIELKKHIDKFFENIEKNEMVYKQA